MLRPHVSETAEAVGSLTPNASLDRLAYCALTLKSQSSASVDTVELSTSGCLEAAKHLDCFRESIHSSCTGFLSGPNCTFQGADSGKKLNLPHHFQPCFEASTVAGGPAHS